MDYKYLSYAGLKRFFYTKILKLINLKIDKTNGDISNTKIRSVDTIETKFPIPAAGETAKQFLGKVLTFLKNIKPLESDATYYVSATSGSDTTGDGSQAKPFNTLTKALNSIPKNLGGCIATINIADGSYGTSGFAVNKYYNGTFRIMGNEESPGNVVLPSNTTSFTIGDNYAVKFVISGMHFKVTGNNSCIHLYNTYSVSFNNCIIEGNNTAGINWNTASLKVTDTVFNKCNFCLWSPNTSTSWQTNTDANSIARVGSCSGVSNGSICLLEKGILQLIDEVLPDVTSAPVVKYGAMIVKSSGAIIGTLQSSVTYYVATTGLDTNAGTSNSPFKTIKRALDAIPKNLGGYTATINIDDGTYDESVSINGYHSGILVIKSINSPETLNALCRVKKATVVNCDARIQFHGLYFTQTDDVALSVTGCDMVFVKACQAIESATSSYAFDFTYSTARLNSCKSLNHRNCIRSYLSDISSESWTDSSAAEWGISVSGGKLSKVGNQPSGTYGPESIQDGGIIVSKYGGSIGALINSVTLYVATTGSDITGSGSSSSPYRTIQYALNTIPKDLGGYTVVINIVDGVYYEEVVVNGFYGGVIEIRSQSSPEALNIVCKVRRIVIKNCSARIQLYGIYFTQTNDIALDANGCSMIFVRCCQAVEPADTATAFNFWNTKARMSGCKCLNHSIGVKTVFSEIHSENWAASSALTYGLLSDYGSTISKIGTQPSGTQGTEFAQNGGTIIDQSGTFSMSELRVDTNVYVSATGNDTTGNGTQSSPYKTIKYALGTIPRDLGGYTAVIYLADGTYDEVVTVNGYHRGVIEIRSQSSPEALSTACKVRRMIIRNCQARIQVYGIYLTQTNDTAFTTTSCDMVYVRCCQAIESAPLSIAFDFAYSKARVSGCKSTNHINCIKAFFSEVGSSGWVDSSAVEHGLISDSCSRIAKSGNQPSGDKRAEYLANGGIIVSKYGAQIGSLQWDISLYVSPSGSDTTGDGTNTGPYKTIKYAIGQIPRDLNGYTATVYLEDGTYDEVVDIRGYSNGTVDLRSRSSVTALNTVCRVKKIAVFYCSAKINLFGLYMTQTDDIAIDIANNSSIVYLMGCQAIESAPSSVAFNITYSKTRIDGCKVLNHRICAKAIFSDMMSRDWIDSSAFEYGIASDTGGKILKIGAQPSGRISSEYTSNGGQILEANGTQISELINSGLSCTWGTISGGIVRNGITGGTGMITVQLRIQTNTTLTAGNDYVVTGFPLPSISTGASCSFASTTLTCHITSDGILHWQILQNINPNTILLFNCTYLTKS